MLQISGKLLFLPFIKGRIQGVILLTLLLVPARSPGGLSPTTSLYTTKNLTDFLDPPGLFF